MPLDECGTSRLRDPIDDSRAWWELIRAQSGAGGTIVEPQIVTGLEKILDICLFDSDNLLDRHDALLRQEGPQFGVRQVPAILIALSASFTLGSTPLTNTHEILGGAPPIQYSVFS